MDRRQLLAALAATPLLPHLARAQGAPSLAGDIDILRRALVLHPGLYRYNTPRAIDARITRLSSDFAAAPTLEARYLLLSRFLATIRCGHSYANFFNQKRAVATALFDRPTRLPFHFRWIGVRMIVIADPAGLDLPPGSEVETVNGTPAKDMLARLLPYVRADWHNDAKRVALLGVSGGDRIETFDVFHGLIYGPPAGGTHRITLRLPDGRTETHSLRAIGLAEHQAQMTPRDYAGDRPVWDWSLRPDGVAILTMPGWGLYDSKWNWRAWLDDRLNSLAGAKGLIVDLRDNEGGEDCGDVLLARLIDRPIVERNAERRLRFQRTPPDLDRYLDTWDDSFRTLGVTATPRGDGTFLQTGAQADDSVRPTGPRLALPVAALIGPVNSSATFSFAVKARLSGRVRLFGETTGGNQRGINGGCFFFVRLPASGLEFDLPLISYFPPGHPPDAGVDPDFRVAPTAADIAAGRDPVMSRALDWIARS
jgi:hypothetical protein